MMEPSGYSTRGSKRKLEQKKRPDNGKRYTEAQKRPWLGLQIKSKLSPEAFCTMKKAEGKQCPSPSQLRTYAQRVTKEQPITLKTGRHRNIDDEGIRIVKEQVEEYIMQDEARYDR